jgi:hypothetical protein
MQNPFENGSGSIPNEERAFWTGMGWGNPFENALLHFRLGRCISEWVAAPQKVKRRDQSDGKNRLASG